MSGENRVALLQAVGGDPNTLVVRTPQTALQVLFQAKVTVMFGRESISTTAGDEVFYDQYGWDITLALEALAQQIINRRSTWWNPTRN